MTEKRNTVLVAFDATSPTIEVEAFEPTMELRFALPDRTTTDAPRLQRAWRSRSTGALRWEDVPTVVVPGL